MPRVSLVRGDDRRENVRRSLDLVAQDVMQGVGSKQVIIKPNLVSPSIQLASSHIDQMRGILDFFASIYQGTIIIAEASCCDTWEAYRNFGYLDLPREYNVELVDLNDGPFEVITVSGGNDKLLKLRVARLLLDDTNYLISAARMKTHDTVVVSLSVKNMAMGSIFSDDKKDVHQGIRETNRFIAGIAGNVWPDLAVIDGYEGMEGDGPSHGASVPLRVAISSTDALAADRIACEIMGVELHNVGYLHHCADQGLGETELNRIEILGARVSDCIRPFRLHRSVKEQYAWK